MTSIPCIPVQPTYEQKPTRYIAPHLATSTPYKYAALSRDYCITCCTSTRPFVCLSLPFSFLSLLEILENLVLLFCYSGWPHIVLAVWTAPSVCCISVLLLCCSLWRELPVYSSWYALRPSADSCLGPMRTKISCGSQYNAITPVSVSRHTLSR